MNAAIKALAPSVRQLSDYTDGQVLPPIEKVEFRPGKGRGRPPKGREAKVFTSIAEVAKFLYEGGYKAYNSIVVKFQNDCHIFMAKVEMVFEKIMLVIPETGILCSVSAVIETPEPV